MGWTGNWVQRGAAFFQRRCAICVSSSLLLKNSPPSLAGFFSALTPFLILPSSFYRRFYYFDFRQAIPRMRMQSCLLSSSSQHPPPIPRASTSVLGHCFKVCPLFIQGRFDPSTSFRKCCYVWKEKERDFTS